VSYCLTFSIRHRAPLHLCFSSRSEATLVLKTFASDALTAGDDELVLVNDAAGFLKRSFVSVELGHFPDDDGNDDDDDEGDTVVPPSRRKRPKSRRARPGSSAARTELEAGLDRIVGPLRSLLNHRDSASVEDSSLTDGEAA
jgi:hypothetical protein